MRLSVFKNNREYFLHLPNDFSINLEEYDGSFDFTTAFRGGYSDNFELPTEGNEEALSYMNVVESIMGFRVFDSKLYGREGLLYTGKLLIEEVDISHADATVECNFITDDFAALVAEKTISDVCVDFIIELGDGTQAGVVADAV